MTQAVLLGAGRGSRLDSVRGAGPKWLLDVAGQSIAQHLVNVLHGADVAEVLLVRGALGGAVLTPSVAHRDVLGSRNMVETLYAVRDHVRGDVIIGYCDLLLEPRIIDALLACSAPASVVVDRRWRYLFSLRADDAASIAESCRLSGDKILDLGQPLRLKEEPDAQYLGLMRFSGSVFRDLMDLYETLASNYAGKPWRNASTFEAAYFTDFLQEGIARGIALTAVVIDGGWLEFDAPRDLDVARQLVSEPRPEIFDFSSLPRHPSVLSAGGLALRGARSERQVLLVGTGAAGGWRIPKGMLDAGEAKEAAACREVAEETGVPVAIEGFLERADWVYTFGGRAWQERCYFYRLRALTCSAPRPDAEHAVAAWVPAQAALSGMQYETERHALALALS